MLLKMNTPSFDKSCSCAALLVGVPALELVLVLVLLGVTGRGPLAVVGGVVVGVVSGVVLGVVLGVGVGVGVLMGCFPPLIFSLKAFELSCMLKVADGLLLLPLILILLVLNENAPLGEEINPTRARLPPGVLWLSLGEAEPLGSWCVCVCVSCTPCAQA